MTLKALIASDVTDVFLNEDEFAETVAYTPQDGAARDITVVVRHKQETVDGKPVDYENEVIHVFCQRDETAGITDPRRGEKLEWQTATDATPFGFTGRIVSSDEVGWTLEFSRPKATVIGGKKSTTVLGRA